MNYDQLPTPINANNPDTQQFDESSAVTTHVAPVRKSPIKKVLLIFFIILLIAGNVALGYLYYKQSKELADYKSQVKELQAKATEDTAKEEKDAASATTYVAEVGKFTLSLPKEYVIIKQIDGGYEGGPATWLAIGKATVTKGVVDGGNGFSEITIQAYKKANFGENVTLDGFINSTIDPQMPKTAQPMRTIDGVNVQVYNVNVFSNVEHHYFEKGDVFYHIENNAIDAVNTATINAIYSGFKFN